VANGLGIKVRLRPLEPTDSGGLFKWINTRELVVLSAPFREVTREAHQKWFEEVRFAEDVRIFAIVSEKDDVAIGYCQLKKIDQVSRNAELQIRIGELDMQGRGAGTHAVRELIHFGFDALGLHRIYLQVFKRNKRALRTYLKCGFSIEGVQREAVCIDGVFEDVVMMGLLSDQRI
jgi:RimJ/RimL family protein N-acetyltransferase